MKTRKIKNKQPYVALLNETSDTAAWRRCAALVHSANTPEYGPDVLFEPPPGSPHPFVENVAAFVAFLRESGGFAIY